MIAGRVDNVVKGGTLEAFLEQWSFVIPVWATLYGIVPLVTGKVRSHTSLFSSPDPMTFDVTYSREKRPARYWSYVTARIAMAAGCWIAWALWARDLFEH